MVLKTKDLKAIAKSEYDTRNREIYIWESIVVAVQYLAHYNIIRQNASQLITKCNSYFITKCDKSLLQNASGLLVQYATAILQNVTVAIRCVGSPCY